MTDLNALCYIQEQTSSPDDYKEKFGYEVHGDINGRFYLTFPAILHSFNVLNRNNRVYIEENIMDLIKNDEYITDQLRKNCWMGEIDHPASEIKDQQLSVQRISVPDLKKTSHYIRSPKARYHNLEANIQTDSSNEHGMNMAIKIVDGKIIPAFSARVFGELSTATGRPVVTVKKLICYDWVLFQSHKEALAKVTQPLQEAVEIFKERANSKIIYFKELAQMAANNSKEVQYLCESFDLDINSVIGMTSTGNSVVIQENNNTYLQPLTDGILKNKTQRVMKDWLNS